MILLLLLLKGENIMKPFEAKETPKIRAERVRNSPSLHTRIVESKRNYNRKRDKAQMRRDIDA